MLFNSSGELPLPGKEKQPPLGVDAHHEQEAGDEQEQGEEEGGEQEGGRQGGRGAGLFLQQQDRQAAEAEKQLQERLQYNIQRFKFSPTRLRALPTLLPRWQITPRDPLPTSPAQA